VENVFISHSSVDREKALKLAGALQARGHKVWWDEQLVSGDDFKAMIEAKLSEVDAVVVMWSEAANASDYVKEEARVTRDRLVPVRYDRRLQPPDEFLAIHAEYLGDWNGLPRAAEIEALSQRILKLKADRDRAKLGVKLKLTAQQQSLLGVVSDSAMPGGLQVASFVLGVIASGVGMWVLLFAVNLFVGDPKTAPGLIWLILLLLGMASARAMNQLIQVAKGQLSLRFYDNAFAFSCAICGMAGLLIALGLVLQTHLVGAVSVDDASGTLQTALAVAMVVLVASYFVRILITMAKVLNKRVET
jgi:hypothetical protein